jgi:hypothetical protein
VDISIWLGIAFFLLSIPMGIATNMLTPRFVSYLEKRKLIKSNRSREQDIAAYRSIEAFKNGSRDKYASYIAMSALSVIFAMGGATCVLLLALKYGTLVEDTVLQHQPVFFLSFLTFVFLLLSFLFLAIIIGTARRIDRFAEYTAEIRKKWGDDAV